MWWAERWVKNCRRECNGCERISLDGSSKLLQPILLRWVHWSARLVFARIKRDVCKQFEKCLMAGRCIRNTFNPPIHWGGLIDDKCWAFTVEAQQTFDDLSRCLTRFLAEPEMSLLSSIFWNLFFFTGGMLINDRYVLTGERIYLICLKNSNQ